MARARRAIAAIALIPALLAGGCGDTRSLPRLDDDARILAFGDSLTHGTGASPHTSYPAALERAIDREVIRSGVPGERAAAGRQRLPRVLERVRPDLLVLCHGGNDILQGTEPAVIEVELLAMIDSARRRDIPVVLVGVPARSLFTGTADLYYRVAERAGVALEDEALETIIDDPALRSDAVHPNARGYRRMASAVRDLLVRAGALAGG